MQDSNFPEVVSLICKEDARYDRRAYEFVRLGLEHTMTQLAKKEGAKVVRPRHVSGPELVHGLRVYALDQYGPLAKTVLNAWGVRRSADFGEIVFNLIEYNLFSKSESDRREDFANIFDFEEAFVHPFLPARKSSADRVA